MANFSDYVKNENNNINSDNTYRDNVNKNEKLEEMIENYSKLSENDLMKEFMRLTLEKKKNGNLSDKELENIKNTILPFLNNEQKDNLEKLIKMVKNV